ncbi:MAG: hypothetical protein EBU90_04830 [Proteobacteria bacterium]|nr:hypothetical protein [Pseudomonadota bacterium]NBP13757.1 hypothetical protein [bacterium]
MELTKTTDDYSKLESFVTLEHSFLLNRPGTKLLVTNTNSTNNTNSANNTNSTNHPVLTQCPSDFTVIEYKHLLDTAPQQFDVIIIPFVFNMIHNPHALLQNIIPYMSETTEIYLYLKHFNSPGDRVFGILREAITSDFSTNSLKMLCNKNGLELDSITFVDAFQNYTIFKLTKSMSSDSNVVSYLVDELETNLYDVESYNQLKYHLTICRNLLENIILHFRCQGYTVVDCCSDEWINLYGLSYLIHNTTVTFPPIQSGSNLLLIYNKSNLLDVWQKLSQLLLTHTGKLELLNTSTLSLYRV